MEDFSKGDIVNHPREGSTVLRVISPPALNNNEYMVAECLKGMCLVTIQDSPSKFTLVKKKDKA